MLTETVRSWIDNLPEKSINSWVDMQAAFRRNFEGTYKRPHTLGDLQRCVQGDDESSRDYLARWITMNNDCENVLEETAVQAFVEGSIKGSLLRHSLKRNDPKTLGEMIAIATRYADADDDARDGRKGNILQLVVKKANTNKRKNHPEEKSGGEMFAAAFGGRGG
jgi:hypothetical protein